MVYTKSTLAMIGRRVIDTNPALANSILQQIQPVENKDVSKIPGYFIAFCSEIDVNPNVQKEICFNRVVSENNKVFISAMVNIYNDQPLLVKTITETLKKKQQLISRHISEVKFRYKKDHDFKNKVDNILKLFL